MSVIWRHTGEHRLGIPNAKGAALHSNRARDRQPSELTQALILELVRALAGLVTIDEDALEGVVVGAVLRARLREGRAGEQREESARASSTVHVPQVQGAQK